ncbi:LysR family transcriptional regulator [Enterococcus sp. DIV0876]|uniref:LysR family transcriptional regulator n=1 Tax=Enterococcus sp. DIV0876 TaxID=2774633 RepID=UPI003D2FF53D
MNLDHLNYFKKVAERKNITQAAQELYISQPALSRAMKHLESELGVPLFYHTGRNIELTLYAEAFYPYVKKTLDQYDQGLAAIQALNEEMVPSITIYSEVASVSLPNLVGTFVEKHPEIQLSIKQHGTAENSKDQVYYITSEPKAGLTNLPIFTEPILLALPKKHPLAVKDDLLVADLQHLPLLMLTTNSPLRRTIDEAFEAKKIALTIGSTTDDPATLRSLINQGIGITFFPKITWAYDPNAPFVLRKLADFPLSRTIYLSSSFTETHPMTKMIAKTLTEFFIG